MILKEKKFYIILGWLVFTTVLAVWWMLLGFRHVDMLAELLPDQAAHWIGQRNMLLWEGLSWITLLILGGVACMYFMFKEKIYHENFKTFFAAFNHDVKTSLASLRLQAEALKEDGINPEILDRLISDTMRLQVQLENSLYMGADQASRVLLEEVSFKKFLDSARMRWPQIQIILNKDEMISVDQRGLTTILNNLIQNSLVHGNATEIHFTTKKNSSQNVEISFYDNGKGFSGSIESLGRLFYRPTSKSGSGIGLYVCHDLLQKMNGRLLLNPSQNGFSGAFVVKGAP